jgi:hypothetical protein
MSDLVYDLPQSFLEDEESFLVIDENFGFYKPRREHDGNVFVEKCIVRKGQYRRTPLTDSDSGAMVTKSNRTDAFLIKETNFQNIGGGLQSFERHYATLPTTWYQYEEVTYQASYNGRINYRNRSGSGASWSRARNVLAKASHYYLGKGDVPQDRHPDTSNAGIDFANDFTKFFNIAPQAYIGSNWESYTTPNNPLVVAVVAPDKINTYLGEIYELIRYTIEF